MEVAGEKGVENHLATIERVAMLSPTLACVMKAASQLAKSGNIIAEWGFKRKSNKSRSRRCRSKCALWRIGGLVYNSKSEM
jgi:hypothetical protein